MRDRMLEGMSDATTIRVSKATRDEIRALAEADGVTLDTKLRQLVRRERQRQMGEVLAEPLTAEQEEWVAGSASTVGRHAGR